MDAKSVSKSSGNISDSNFVSNTASNTKDELLEVVTHDTEKINIVASTPEASKTVPDEGNSRAPSSSQRNPPKSSGSRMGSNTLPLMESCNSNLSRLLSGSGSCLLTDGVSSSEDRLNARFAEGKLLTPRRHPRTKLKGLQLESIVRKERDVVSPLPGASSSTNHNNRPCHQHCFLTDVADVRQMEQGLLQLLDNFHSGKLQAFGQDCTLEKMEQVREQQDRLAKLHFDLNTRQEMIGPQTTEGRRIAKENLPKLIDNLQQLSLSIEQLQSASPGVQTEV